jgi:1,2-diacylglycerol 3-alpha-glucosyltransferase
MRVAIFAEFFYPELSGITDSITALGKELAQRGHTVMFVVPWYSKSEYKVVNAVKNDNFGPNIIIKRMPSLDIPFSPTGQNHFPLFLGLGTYWLKKFKPDIIHTHSPLVPGWEALLASKLLKIPIVATNHTPPSEFIKGPKWFVNSICRYYSWYYNKFDFITTPSQSLVDYMMKYGFNKKSIPVSNPIDTTNFFPARSQQEKKELKKQFSFTDHTVLYTGRLALEKRIDDIIRAVALAQKEIPDIFLAITGRGNAETKLKELAEDLGITNKVKFFGYVDNQTYPLIYRAADLFAIMSTAESQSISLILGMATGLPVAGADARALPEYINKDNGVVIPVGDYKKLAENLVQIFSNQGLALQLGVGGIKTANQCSIKIVTDQWEEIYKKAIISYGKDK